MNISENTLDDVLHKLLKRLIKSKLSVEASRGTNREMIGVKIHLKNPRARLSHSERKGKIFSAIGELLWYLSGTDKVRFIEYYLKDYGVQNSEDGRTVHGAYGPRLKNPKTDQLKNVIDLLKRKPSSRRAVVQLFRASDIEKDFLDIPCTCNLQFLRRNKKLDLIVFMRSNDAFRGFSHDVFAFTLIQELVARSLNVELGHYHHFVGSMHLYESDLDAAKTYLAEGWQRTMDAEMPRMPDGSPWPAIKKLLKIESRLRNNRNVDLTDFSLNDYWNDLGRLLKIYRSAKNNKKVEIARLRKEMTSQCFDAYVESREDKVGESTTSQLKLFGQISFSRTSVPRWLNLLTEKLIEERKAWKDQVIAWSSPVPFFGNLLKSKVATVGVNPSNLEFVNGKGEELTGDNRRLETLNSLNIPDWKAAKASHYKKISQTALHYFELNPYSNWFKPLEAMLLDANSSFYGNREHYACHVDLVPFATKEKWASLHSKTQREMLEECGFSLAKIFESSELVCLVLNGTTVTKTLVDLCDVKLTKTYKPAWNLKRKSGKDVRGYSFEGKITHVQGRKLANSIDVLGFNHNLQSSYGVSAAVKSNISDWLVPKISRFVDEK